MTDRDGAGGYTGSKPAAEMRPPEQGIKPEMAAPGLPGFRAAVDISSDTGLAVNMTVEGPHRIVAKAMESLADSITDEAER